jgi:hypothetical protein
MSKVLIAAALALALSCAVPAAAASPPTPLFASDQPIQITIRGPLATLAAKRSGGALPGTLTYAGQAFPITLAPRGITRLQKDVCQFPPLRLSFAQRPPAGSLFDGQRVLKLVTHCRSAADFQQKVLLEYAAYRLYNQLTPLSFRARLANIDYVDDSGKPLTSRVGFFIEDIDDVARRNNMVKPHTPDRIPASQLDPRGSAQFAVFNYMIGNLDWSMRAGPVGEGCCHNGRLLGTGQSAARLTPVPYDFDFSGLVDAPYAEPPDGIGISSVRERNYRGYCMFSADAAVVAADMSRRRAELIGVLATIPGLDERNRAKATAYLGGFFRDVDSGKIFKTCVS